MNQKLDKLTIKGFKSIRSLDNFELNYLNVVVGENGAGKSNFISFFRLLNAFINGSLKRFVTSQGGISDLLFNGLKTTEQLFFEMHFGEYFHRFTVLPTPSNSCEIEHETLGFTFNKSVKEYTYPVTNTSGGSFLYDLNKKQISELLQTNVLKHFDDDALKFYNAIKSIQIYHFHDTSITSKMQSFEIIQDHQYLRKDADNIAPFLRHLKLHHLKHYQEIVNAIRLVTPFFYDFILEPQFFGESEKVSLSWYKQDSDYPMQPYHLSDGTLRFICLATALLQPEPPQTIIIDEPELGLNPAAIMILAELIQSASQRMQVIVATQSPLLLDQFAINDIIIVKNKNGESQFERLNEEDFECWLEAYSVGELWVKNVISGGPQYG